jgi:formylglycine-generating enzyme required for sulfatase activity
VPKGLRSFDAQDADFFLELLPGPRDRQGQPDSIRFWKSRIETQGADTFSVGLIYGPSGCGKSSLIRAGLLPRLANSVTAVYVEATGEETEARLLSGLRRQLADLPTNLGLIKSLAALRQGRFIKRGHKVLLVLDQFEQWLHSRHHEENTKLVQALRQCDGERVQSIVLVRDDFGMAATRFMAALDLGIVQGNNFATVDLFDLRHARKVLTAFGRAFAALPEHDQELTTEQNAFLDQAVSSLSQENKVISVRLALFAEMVKGKSWIPATLKEIGGTEGVGVTFLEDTFASRSANPQHRLHQKAAQAVLKSLLPDAGTDIKGHMRSQQELLEASGYVNRPKDFEELLHILDSEIRLITPTDPEGVAGDGWRVAGEEVAGEGVVGGGWRVAGGDSTDTGENDDGSALSAAGSLATRHGPGGEVLPGDRGIPKAGAVRSRESDPTGGRVDTGERRRGTGEGAHQRVPQSPEHCPRVPDGTGNASAAEPEGRIPQPGAIGGAPGACRSNQQDAQRSSQSAGKAPRAPASASSPATPHSQGVAGAGCRVPGEDSTDTPQSAGKAPLAPASASSPATRHSAPTTRSPATHHPAPTTRSPTTRHSAPATHSPATRHSAPTTRYYQLTHDYLVPSLRNWLTRKQKETRRGRAELLLADRAAVWNARPENRQLPSVVQWFQIKWLTTTKNWTPPQRKMMRQARRYHAVRGLILSVLILAISGIGLATRNYVQEQNQADHAAGLVKRLLAAKIDKVPPIIQEIEACRLWADPLLREENDRAGVGSPQKLHASLALLPVDPGQTTYLYDRLLDAEPHEVPVIAHALAPHKQELLAKLWSVVENPGKGKEKQRLRAASALASFDPNSDKWVKYSPPIVNDLVLENCIFLGQWGESFRPVKNSFLEPLSAVFRNRSPERSDERMSATDLLTDYAADRPGVLADLLMDADEKQFARIYPLVEKNKDRCISEMVRTLARILEGPREKIVFESRGVIAENDPKVKPPVEFLKHLGQRTREVPARRFEVPLQSGKNYQLTMDTDEVDAFLMLQDKSGTDLAYHNGCGGSGGNSNAWILYTPSADDVYTVFATSLNESGKLEKTVWFRLKIIEMVVDEPGEKLAKRQANAAVALLRLKQEEKVWPLLARSQEPDDPRVRSYLIHRFAPFGAEAVTIIKRLDEEKDITVRRALVLSLGEFGDDQLPPHSRHALLAKLRAIYCTDADAGVHGAAEWLLRQWNDGAWLKEVNLEWAEGKVARGAWRVEGNNQLVLPHATRHPTPGWYIDGQGHTMVVIPDPGKPFMMGSPLAEIGREGSERQHKRRIQRTFALAAKPVTVEQYRKFDGDYSAASEFTRMADLPVAGGATWNHAAAYCNWLSQQEGIDPRQWCYETNLTGETGPNVQVTQLRANYLSLQGYRLPTQAEMEYAIRAGAITSRFFGETEELLPKYSWYLTNAQHKTWPVGRLKPNDFGLFDVQGNVENWCQDRSDSYPQGVVVDDKEDSKLRIDRKDRRMMRGASFVSPPSDVRSANGSSLPPEIPFPYSGIRVARTILLDP